MNISILYNVESAKEARGLTVVIDVFRAFSTACYVIGGGADKIIPVGDIEISYKLKKENPDFVLMGERDGVIQPGFDFGNSPFQIKDYDFTGKTVIHTTTMGTRGLVNAKNSEQIITGSFVNVGAIIDYINSQNPEDLSLVCTGTANEHIEDEDSLCAEYIKNALEGKPNHFEKITEHLKKAWLSNRFLDSNDASHPTLDFDYCMDLNKFNFVLKTEPYKDGLLCLRKLDI